MRLLKDERGSATVIAAFGMVAIIGMLVLAIDAGQLRYQKGNSSTRSGRCGAGERAGAFLLRWVDVLHEHAELGQQLAC